MQKNVTQHQKRCAEALNWQDDPTKVTYYNAQEIYKTYNLTKYENPESEKINHSTRFVSEYVDQLWHTDLHFIKSKCQDRQFDYIITFIDDRSGYILYMQRSLTQKHPNVHQTH